MSWAHDYLKLLEEDSTLCVPVLLLSDIAEHLNIPEKALRSRRAYRKDVRDREREIIAAHIGRMKAQAIELGEREPEQEGEEDDLPLALERYLEVYAEIDRNKEGGRLQAIFQLQSEGITLELEDILRAMQEYPSFNRAMQRIWREGDVETEDSLRTAARMGRHEARAMYLKGNMPEKYGNKVKVQVDVTHQLKDEDRYLVEDAKRYFPAPKRRYSPPADEDVVEGVVVEA